VPKGWIERLQNEQVKQWAFDQLLEGNVLWAGGRRDYGCVVAEIQLTDKDIKRFDMPRGATIIMLSADRSKTIDDPEARHSIDDVIFDVENIS